MCLHCTLPRHYKSDLSWSDLIASTIAHGGHTPHDQIVALPLLVWPDYVILSLLILVLLARFLCWSHTYELISLHLMLAQSSIADIVPSLIQSPILGSSWLGLVAYNMGLLLYPNLFFIFFLSISTSFAFSLKTMGWLILVKSYLYCLFVKVNTYCC